MWLVSACCPDLALFSTVSVRAQDPFEIHVYEYEPLAPRQLFKQLARRRSSEHMAKPVLI